MLGEDQKSSQNGLHPFISFKTIYCIKRGFTVKILESILCIPLKWYRIKQRRATANILTSSVFPTNLFLGFWRMVSNSLLSYLVEKSNMINQSIGNWIPSNTTWQFPANIFSLLFLKTFEKPFSGKLNCLPRYQGKQGAFKPLR